MSPRPPSRSRYMLPIALVGATALSYFALKAASGREPRHPPDSAPGRTARQTWFGDYIVTGRSLTIDAPRAELFARWKDVEELPRFMENVRSITVGPDGSQTWRIKGPMDSEVKLVSRIVEERPDEVIAWRSTPQSEIEAEGKVMFREAPGGRGTVMEAIIAYKPPGGTVGHWIGKAFLKDPKAQGRHELKRFKMLVETGEIATARNRKEA